MGASPGRWIASADASKRVFHRVDVPVTRGRRVTRLRARNASVYYRSGSNATKKTRRQHNATLVRKKVPWYKRHGHANATLARRHRGIRHANATRLHHRRNHPRRHNPDGLGAPTPGDAADGVVVAAPEGPIERAGISSELEALAALHQKGALTDGEFAAAKTKLLG